MAKRRRNAPRDYPRTARLNELLREVLAGELERLDDDRIGWVSISGVEVDNELSRARVFLSALDDADAEAAAYVLREYRGRFRRAIGNEARLRKVPELEFAADPAIRSGGRVEQILAELERNGELLRDDDTEPAAPAEGASPEES